jgi:hypothetical protein
LITITSSFIKEKKLVDKVVKPPKPFVNQRNARLGRQPQVQALWVALSLTFVKLRHVKQKLCSEDLIFFLCIGLFPINVLGERCVVGDMIRLFSVRSAEWPHRIGVLKLLDEELARVTYKSAMAFRPT